MEEVLNAEVAKEFLKKSRAGSKVFFVQRNVNRSDLFWSLANMAEKGSTAPSSFQRGVRGKGGLAGCSNCATSQPLSVFQTMIDELEERVCFLSLQSAMDKVSLFQGDLFVGFL
jgi:hypothetical protein